MNVYVISLLGVEAFRVVRKTKTGWTVLANWSNEGATQHIKENKYRSSRLPHLQNTYTATSADEAVYLAARYREVMELNIRDFDSSVMKIEGEL